MEKLSMAEDADENIYEGQGKRIEASREPLEYDKDLAMNVYMTEMLLIFRENIFLMKDFTKNSSWQVGDCESKHFQVDEDASIVMVDPQKHNTN